MNTARANRENGAGNIYIGFGDSQLSLMDSHQARPEPVHTVCSKPPLKRPPSREEHLRQRLIMSDQEILLKPPKNKENIFNTIILQNRLKDKWKSYENIAREAV
ncbi:unnamed protein product [Arabidopsis thaliana]|uniref:Uncharacterized protein n=1 Tax=Arabidopsis thaliana TaxID=3702 RepID=A0A5S9X0Q5_ARATH|nr:unnamed protein product [Arabidopsis thaliana]